MLDQHDLEWLASRATQLKGLLQQVSRCSDKARLHRGEDRYLDLLKERVEQATLRSEELFDRLVSRTVTGTTKTMPGMLGNLASVPSNARSTANKIVKLPLGEVGVDFQVWEEPLVRNPKGTKEMILVVDDDEEVLERTAEILDFEDYRVVAAKDGPEALRIYRNMGEKIALVLLDYFLPVMDGDAVFDELQAINSEVQVVLTSGFGEQAKLGSMLAHGLRGFIPKPYTHEKLIEQIRLILDA
ncbi:MAG TPA: response regulator [Chthoniobacterales bacterium]|jgi:CheY-like chemotaxis protein